MVSTENRNNIFKRKKTGYIFAHWKPFTVICMRHIAGTPTILASITCAGAYQRVNRTNLCQKDRSHYAHSWPLLSVFTQRQMKLSLLSSVTPLTPFSPPPALILHFY